MDTKLVLSQRGIATVSDLVALGMSRHKARHDLEALVAAGEAQKTKDGNTVTYSMVPENLERVVSSLRPAKALSASVIARRSGLPVTEVLGLLAIAVRIGKAARPYHSPRFRRA